MKNKIQELTVSLNGEPVKVKVGEVFEMSGKKWFWQHKENDYSVVLVEKKEAPIGIHHPEWVQKAYNDLNFAKLNPEE